MVTSTPSGPGRAPTPARRGSGRQTQQLVVTVLALYGRDGAAGLTAAELLRLLSLLDVDGAAVRSALSRLKKREVLVHDQDGSTSRYRLNPALEQVFREGDERIFHPRRSRPGDRWLLAVFSVPEAQRHLRHQIRKILGHHGFGTVGSGLWIAPAHVFDVVRRDLDRAGLSGFVEFFAADHLANGDLADKVARWWDLTDLAAHYRGFVDEFAPVRARWQRADPRTEPVDAFADYVPALTAWRRLPYLDPGLPEEYLPTDWPGLTAAQLFLDLHHRLAEPSRDCAEELVRGAPPVRRE
ncbi:MAG TPA: PaaX family transcriptional regulator C-terminal domain-containing protein [Segeticoccus sp.]|nr:PaaX family transcriptional regulator C-terminal domain-containing protein [Segeticoccus sp.]